MSVIYSNRPFEEEVEQALGDETLRGALRHVTDKFAGLRQEAAADLPEWEQMREYARLVKAETLFRLDHYLEQFVERAEEAGARVHWARDGEEACRIVGDLAREIGATRLIKSKSMVTEEINLNHALISDDGEEPVETDLGEWIVQLAGEKPSHIIAPAIHKTRGQIADLFVEKLAIEPTDDIEQLTAAARRVLRRHFAEADLGISGVNFAIAETGSMLTVENEGNIRLTTSLPRVHVAVMGIEKLLPRFDDLEVFLRLLPRSGTGQHITSYQSIITGVNKGGEGPEQVHIVLLDNGRSEMLSEEVTRQSLACIRCGACLNICPVYQQIGGHAYGSVYPGPIGAVITPALTRSHRAKPLPFASSLCGACRDVCPVKIDIPALLLHQRDRINSSDSPSRAEALGFRAWSWVMRSPARYRFAAALARAFPWAWRGRMGAWTKARELRPMARRSFRADWEASR